MEYYLIITLEFSYPGEPPSAIAFRVGRVSQLSCRSHTHLYFLQIETHTRYPNGKKAINRNSKKTNQD
jgi:hypothetical protein